MEYQKIIQKIGYGIGYGMRLYAYTIAGIILILLFIDFTVLDWSLTHNIIYQHEKTLSSFLNLLKKSSIIIFFLIIIKTIDYNPSV